MDLNISFWRDLYNRAYIAISTLSHIFDRNYLDKIEKIAQQVFQSIDVSKAQSREIKVEVIREYKLLSDKTDDQCQALEEKITLEAATQFLPDLPISYKDVENEFFLRKQAYLNHLEKGSAVSEYFYNDQLRALAEKVSDDLKKPEMSLRSFAQLMTRTCRPQFYRIITKEKGGLIGSDQLADVYLAFILLQTNGHLVQAAHFASNYLQKEEQASASPLTAYMLGLSAISSLIYPNLEAGSLDDGV